MISPLSTWPPPTASELAEKINEIASVLNTTGHTLAATPVVSSTECLHDNSYSLNRNGNWRCKTCKKIWKKSE